jgi:hypothetical protein
VFLLPEEEREREGEGGRGMGREILKRDKQTERRYD